MKITDGKNSLIWIMMRRFLFRPSNLNEFMMPEINQRKMKQIIFEKIYWTEIFSFSSFNSWAANEIFSLGILKGNFRKFSLSFVTIQKSESQNKNNYIHLVINMWIFIDHLMIFVNKIYLSIDTLIPESLLTI